MPTFLLTAMKNLTGLPDGMMIEKGARFEVNVQITCTSPFGTNAGRDACIRQLNNHGYDFSEHPTWLNSTFKFVKIGG